MSSHFIRSIARPTPERMLYILLYDGCTRHNEARSVTLSVHYIDAQTQNIYMVYIWVRYQYSISGGLHIFLFIPTKPNQPKYELNDNTTEHLVCICVFVFTVYIVECWRVCGGLQFKSLNFFFCVNILYKAYKGTLS